MKLSPDDPGYDEWLDDQASRGQHQLDLDTDALEYLTEGDAISATVEAELTEAVRHAVQWLDVPLVLRIVADVIEAFDLAELSDDDEPF